MLEKVKAAIKKMKPETKKKKKAESKFNNMDDLQKGVAVNKELKSETKSETKSSLTFGN
tara:strand:- start:1009 stop:1185 length:177 start_codon:yes stop_codon:yes gene_type:complete